MRVLLAAALAVCFAASPASAGQRWLVLSDLHVLPADRIRTPSGSGWDSNWALFDSTLRAARAADPQPDVVVVAGDFLAHHFHGDAVATMARIARGFARAFPDAQFLVVQGNNDDPCGDYRNTVDSPYLAQLARIWKPLVNRRGAAPNFMRDFSHGGYYVAAVPGTKLHVVALNSVYWSILYHNPCGGYRANPGAAEFAWLERSLARSSGPKIVVMHIPPGVDVGATLLLHRLVVLPFFTNGATARFLRDVATPRNGVAAVIAGHVHRADFRVFSGVPILIAPSISPVYRNDPAFLELRVTPQGAIADFTLYRYSALANRWSARFDFDRDLQANGLSAAALTGLHWRLAVDPALRRTWENLSQIDAAASRGYWCAQATYGAAYASCAGAVSFRFIPWRLGAALFVAIVVLIVWLCYARMRWIAKRKNA